VVGLGLVQLGEYPFDSSLVLSRLGRTAAQATVLLGLVVPEEEQERDGTVAAHQPVVHIDAVGLQLGVIGAGSGESNAIPVIRPGW